MKIPTTHRHPFQPVFDKYSHTLVLGSFPSVKSREIGFYYGHPQNRFWPLLSTLFEETAVPLTTEERRRFVLHHGIALWDTIASCEITGSSDASIRNAVPNDIAGLIKQSSVTRVFCNGKRSYYLYMRFCVHQTGMNAILLPSTSAANAAWSLPRLAQAWKVIRV